MTQIPKAIYGPCALVFCSTPTGTWRIVRPLIDKEKCVLCGMCEKHCPTGIMDTKKVKSVKPAEHYLKPQKRFKDLDADTLAIIQDQIEKEYGQLELLAHKACGEDSLPYSCIFHTLFMSDPATAQSKLYGNFF